MEVLDRYIGQASPVIVDTIKLANPATGLLEPVDLISLGYTVTFKSQSPDGTMHVSAPATPLALTSNPDSPNVRYTPTPTTWTTAGDYVSWWTVTLSPGDDQDTPEFIVRAKQHGVVPTGTEVLDGPCGSWITNEDIVLFIGAEADDTDYTLAIDAATSALYAASGHRYTGTCTKTVRPCREACSCWGAGAGPGWSYPVTWGPAGWGDACGSSCGCGPETRIRLSDYPVTAVTSVKIDGVTVDATTYRLEQQRYLARTDGSGWPACQDMNLPNDSTGSFSITYQYGEAATILAKQAAAELAYSLYRQAHGGACSLPESATSVTRQGVTYQTNTIYDAIGMRTTGLAYVDAFLASANPNRWRNRPAIWSPDMRMVRST